MKHINKEFFNKGSVLYIALLVVVLLGLALQLVFPTGMPFEQNIDHAKFGWQLANFFQQEGGFSKIGIWFTQPSKIVHIPVALAYLLWGINDTTSVLYPMVSALVSIVIIFFIGKKLYGQESGLLAAFLWSVLPLRVFYSTTLLWVLPVITLNFIAVYCLALPHQRSRWIKLGIGLASVLAALYLSFALSMGMVILIIYIKLEKHLKRFPNIMKVLLTLGAIGILFQALQGDSALLIYQSFLLVQENIVLIPLLIFSIIWFSKQPDEVSKLPLVWISMMAISVFIISSSLQADPVFINLGSSALWLAFLAPITLIIGQYLSARIDKYTDLWILLIGLLLIGMISGYYLLPDLVQDMLTFSRIATGISFLLIWLILLSGTDRLIYNRVGIVLLLTLIGAASLAQSQEYQASYSHRSKVYDEMYFQLKTLPALPLVVESEMVKERFDYLGKFESEGQFMGYSMVIGPRKYQNKDAHVIISEEYNKYVLVLVPYNWELIYSSEDFLFEIYCSRKH